jgi:hypothetical protein
MALQCVQRGRRRAVTPYDILQAVNADDLADAEGQGGQDRLAPQSTHRPRRLADRDIDWPKQPYLHDSPGVPLTKKRPNRYTGDRFVQIGKSSEKYVLLSVTVSARFQPRVSGLSQSGPTDAEPEGPTMPKTRISRVLTTAMTPAARPLTIMSPDTEHVYRRHAARCPDAHRASSLAELRAVLESLRGKAASPERLRSLDLLGHSTSGHHLLRLGGTPVDMLDPVVARFFRAQATAELMSSLGIGAVRLLGCQTAVTDAGQRTIRMLSRALRMPVYGTLVPLHGGHWRADGFNPAFARVLVEASQLV